MKRITRTSNACRKRHLLAIELTAVLAFSLGILPAGAATNIVRMVNFAFQPRLLTNTVGDTVVWTNTTTTGHDTVSSNGVWSSGGTFITPGTYAFTFTNAGTYGYYCTPHRNSGMNGIVYVNPSPNSPPAIAITNPPTGAMAVAPATIVLRAAASDPDGTVTNVQFFRGANLLGAVTNRPFDLVLNSLTARTYNFTARAFDNLGAVSTSAVVSVYVADLRFETNLVSTGTDFPLTFSLTPGFTYSVEGSSNFTSWDSLTNFVAPTNTFTLSSPTAGFGRRFFRARVVSGP
jgi:plastocyanin